MRIAAAALGLLLAGCRSVPVANQQTPTPEVEPVAVLASTEGPTVDRGGNVYFTFGGITGGRILKWSDGPRRETQPGLPEPPGRVEVFREYGPAGLIFDAAGRLLAASAGPIATAPALPARMSRPAVWNGSRTATRASDSAVPTT
jgi:sugar lactone lactonase YvrE